jgi:hypothetical protein
MKRTAIICLMFIAFFTTMFLNNYSIARQHAKEFYESDFYSFSYPSDWTIEEEGAFKGVLIRPAGVDCRICGFKIFSFNIAFKAEDYARMIVDSADNSTVDMKIIEYSEIDFNGRPAYKIIYTGTEAGEPYKWIRIIIGCGPRLVDVGYTYNQDEFDYYLPLIEEIMESIVLK